MEMENNSLEEEVNVELIDEETEKLLYRLDKKIKICNIVTVISTVVLLCSVYHIRRYGTDLLNAGLFICSLILALGSYADEHRFTDYILKIKNEKLKMKNEGGNFL